MSSHLANISPYLRRAREKIALREGVVMSPMDDGRTVCDPVLRDLDHINSMVHSALPLSSPSREAPHESQLPSIIEMLSIAIVGGIMVITILRGVLGHF